MKEGAVICVVDRRNAQENYYIEPDSDEDKNDVKPERGVEKDHVKQEIEGKDDDQTERNEERCRPTGGY